MIPEKFSVKNLVLVYSIFFPHERYVRLECVGYAPILYTTNPRMHSDIPGCFDSDGFRIVGSIAIDKDYAQRLAKEFSPVYNENFEEFKEAITKLLIKEML